MIVKLALYALPTLGLLLGVPELRTQSRLFSLQGSTPSEPFFQVRSIGDVNGDGCADIAQTLYWSPVPTGSFDVLRIYSGRDGRVLRRWQSGSNIVGDVLGVGDIDLDGYDDYAVHRYVAPPYALDVYSGKGESLLFTITGGPAGLGGNPLAVQAGGDINADGYPDILVGNSYFSPPGRCLVISGKDGAVIHDISPPLVWPRYVTFGTDVRPAGDVNRDGHDDFYVSDWSFGRGFESSRSYGKVQLYSGKDASVLREWIGEWGDSLGFSLALVGDDNRDGIRELVAAAWQRQGRGAVYRLDPMSAKPQALFEPMTGPSIPLGMRMTELTDFDGDGWRDFAARAGYSVLVLSGKTGTVLWERGDSRPEYTFGHLLTSGDINGDGSADLVVGGGPRYWGIPPTAISYFEVWSNTLPLASDTHRVSLMGTGSQQLQLDAGTGHAGAPYLLLGSMTGVVPGLGLGRCTLPLNPDEYMLFTAVAPNTALLSSSLGVLDAQGRAQARFTVIPGLPVSLIGLRVDHAFVSFDNAGPALASNSVPLLFEK